ncbi:MAG: hypothetical protein E7323_12175 [Clostridiales bacterium]|nr:hypothetical protein [Clostridiales bacterium]
MKKIALHSLLLLLVICLLMGTFVTAASAAYHDFGFHYNDEGYAWAQWQHRNQGINFQVKIHNFSNSDYISGFTIALSAKNKYNEPVMLKSSDGRWYDVPLWYSSDISYKPGRTAFSEYFYLQSYEDIKYVTATIVSYQIKGGRRVEIDPYDYETLTWTID